MFGEAESSLRELQTSSKVHNILYHSYPKYKNRFYINIESKRSLYRDTVVQHTIYRLRQNKSANPINCGSRLLWWCRPCLGLGRVRPRPWSTDFFLLVWRGGASTKLSRISPREISIWKGGKCGSFSWRTLCSLMSSGCIPEREPFMKVHHW